jgi:hypothetical protein
VVAIFMSVEVVTTNHFHFGVLAPSAPKLGW